jgi:tRNA (guanine26-N2/guanine27-N2)-dimethyltransferase
MKIARLNAIKVQEASAQLYVPKDCLTDPHHCKVFYNPQMEFSRSISSICLQALKPRLPANPKILDGLCATGARGVRYYLESGKCQVTFNDANALAIAFARRNAALNRLKAAAFSRRDFHVEAAQSHGYDVVELDPFGTPTSFLDSAVRACAKNAILSVTATDLANLCGAKPRPCVREYEAVPSHGYYCHETALRILIGRVARTAAVQARAFFPLASYYFGHHIKTIGALSSSARQADEALAKVGTLGFCKKCFSFQPNATQCKKCKAKLEVCGPLWLSETSDGAVLEAMQKVAEKSEHATEAQAEFITLLLSENRFGPGYLDLHGLCSASKRPVGKKTGSVMAELCKKGFSVSRTHYAPTGIKTDAPSDAVLKVACGKGK